MRTPGFLRLWVSSLVLILVLSQAKAQTNLSNNYVISIDAKDIAASWYINMSNEPVLVKKGVTSARLEFGPEGDYFRERFSYQFKGRTIVKNATDTKNTSSLFIRKTPGAFKGKREWFVVAMDDKKEWMVLYYSGKVFSPAYVHLISRKPELSAEGKARFEKLCKENYFLGAVTKKMASIAP